MSIDFAQFITSIANDQDLIAKVLLLIFMSLYAFFAIILVTQVKHLSKIVDQISVTPIIKGLSALHLGVAVTLLVITVFV